MDSTEPVYRQRADFLHRRIEQREGLSLRIDLENESFWRSAGQEIGTLPDQRHNVTVFAVIEGRLLSCPVHFVDYSPPSGSDVKIAGVIENQRPDVLFFGSAKLGRLVRSGDFVDLTVRRRAYVQRVRPIQGESENVQFFALVIERAVPLGVDLENLAFVSGPEVEVSCLVAHHRENVGLAGIENHLVAGGEKQLSVRGE